MIKPRNNPVLVRKQIKQILYNRLLKSHPLSVTLYLWNRPPPHFEATSLKIIWFTGIPVQTSDPKTLDVTKVGQNKRRTLVEIERKDHCYKK